MHKKIIIFILTLLVIIAALNIEVSTRQGVDYKVRTIKLPLYLKLLDFFDRHYHYKLLAESIVRGQKEDEEKVLRILGWTSQNMKRQPESLSTVDDHVWYTIVRGYGSSDQFSDVFITLCNYAGFKGLFTLIIEPETKSKLILSFVKIKDRWFVFDPFNGVYFRSADGKLADLSLIKKGAYNVVSLRENPLIDYPNFFKAIPSLDDSSLARSQIQSPLRRLFYEMRKNAK
jgi:hypothetical protein